MSIAPTAPVKPKPSGPATWYRYEDRCFSRDPLTGFEISDEFEGTPLRFPVVKETTAGVWLLVYGERKFVLSGDGKRFAYPSKTAALNSYIARKNRHIRILEAMHKAARARRQRAEHLMAGLPPFKNRPL